MKKNKEYYSRRSINTVSFVLTGVLLFLAVQFSDGGGQFATRINEITQNLKNAVIALQVNVSYTNFTDNSTYYSSTDFRAGGMAGLYNLTNLFIDTLSPSDILMDGILSVDHNSIHIYVPQASAVTKYYASLFAITLFLCLCIILFPLCGLCFCCCRCCGNCGAKPRQSNKKKDTCRKVLYATLLIFCGTGLLFCIVCAFGSNRQLQDGIEEFPENLNKSIIDTKTYMDSSNAHVHHLLDYNYKEFSGNLTGIMDNATNITMEHLIEYKNAQSLSMIRQFVESLNDINNTLHGLKTETNRLRVYASQLSDSLRKVKRDLSQTLMNCSEMKLCQDLSAKISQLKTDIDFNRVPDVNDAIDIFESLNPDNLMDDVREGEKSLDNIRNQIDKSLRSGLDAAKDQIALAGNTIEESLQSVTDAVNNIKSQIDSTATPVIQKSNTFINDYGQYRYIVGVTICCILLFVAICIVFGLICGVCGKRPDGYTDNCCNKGTGSQFLICGVYIMFLFGFIISILTVISLLLGVVSEKMICDPLRDPNPNKYRIIKLLDDLDLQFGVEITPSSLLNNCYQNQSLYNTFNLGSKFDISKIRGEFNITEQLKTLDFDIDTSNIHLLGDGSLKDLRNINPNINVQAFREELSRNLTNYNLDELANGLREIISNLKSDSAFKLRTSVELSLLHITTYEEKLVEPMKNLSFYLINTAQNLSNQLNMGFNSFQEAIDELLSDVEQTEKALQNDAPRKLQEAALEFGNITLALITDYIDRLDYQFQYEVGQCGPLNLVIHGALTSTCEKVLLPWNGFWFSLFWTIILYVITIIISVILAILYQRQKPYDQYVETRGGKRGKKRGKKSKRYEDRPGMGRDVARDYAGGSNHPDGRYADMAPKHWEDFPNGGPPHYQRAPTEYERPPPYYYPGNGGEQ
ncbi:hypothetical protein ABEB36_010505 [Hypothenemus hampei]|uniref:Prominin-like protein n=1 Tax=Hypothenemus hampei TaxID=57062 RepID=A0ABD1EJY8_HYPHA